MPYFDVNQALRDGHTEDEITRFMRERGLQPLKNKPGMTISETTNDTTTNQDSGFQTPQLTQTTKAPEIKNVTGYTTDQLFKAKAAAQRAGDKKYVKYYNDLLDTEISHQEQIGKEKEAKEATVDTERIGTIKNIAEDLKQFETRRKEIPESFRGPGIKSAIPSFGGAVVPGVPQFDAMRDGTAYGLANAIAQQTGRAISDSDFNKFRGLLPTRGDTEETAQAKLQDITNEFKSRLTNYGMDQAEANQLTTQLQSDLGLTKKKEEKLIDDTQPLEMDEELEMDTGGIAGGVQKTLEAGLNIVDLVVPHVKEFYEGQKKQTEAVREGDKEQLFYSLLETVVPVTEFLNLEEKKVDEIDANAAGLAAEVALILYTPKIVKGLKNKLGISSVEKTSKARKAIAKTLDKANEVAKSGIDGSKWIDDAINMTDDISEVHEKTVAKNLLRAGEKKYGKNFTYEQAVKFYTKYNDAFNANKQVGKSASAKFNEIMLKSLKKQLPQELMDATTEIAKAYGWEGIKKRVFNPEFVLKALIALGAYRLGSKALEVIPGMSYGGGED